MAQVMPFTNGGFVVHRAYLGSSKCKFSAWFDMDDRLLDAHAVAANGRSARVTEAARKELQQNARLYRAQLR